jgi:hypothetical protein
MLKNFKSVAQEHFPEKWPPVFRRKCDQIKNLSPALIRSKPEKL